MSRKPCSYLVASVVVLSGVPLAAPALGNTISINDAANDVAGCNPGCAVGSDRDLKRVTAGHMGSKIMWAIQEYTNIPDFGPAGPGAGNLPEIQIYLRLTIIRRPPYFALPAHPDYLIGDPRPAGSAGYGYGLWKHVSGSTWTKSPPGVLSGDIIVPHITRRWLRPSAIGNPRGLYWRVIIRHNPGTPILDTAPNRLAILHKLR
jgi:hypothetical protein